MIDKSGSGFIKSSIMEQERVQSTRKTGRFETVFTNAEYLIDAGWVKWRLFSPWGFLLPRDSSMKASSSTFYILPIRGVGPVKSLFANV